MAISFNQIPLSVLVPGTYVEFQALQANAGLAIMPSRILVLGQMLPAGAAPPNIPVRIFGYPAAAKLFGRGSMLATMIAALLQANSFTELWACPQLDNPAGSAAAGSVTFAGPAASAGTATLYVAANNVLALTSFAQIGIQVGMTAAQMATAMAAAINAIPDLGVTAALDGQNTAKVDLTAKHAGLWGNDIDLRTTYYTGDQLPAGVAMTVAPMSGGSGNPALQASIAALGDHWFTTIICPYYDGASLAAINAEAARRAGPTVQQPARITLGYPGSTSTATAFGATQDSQYQAPIGSHLSPSHPALWAAVTGAVIEYSANIDPARPLQTLSLPGLLAPAMPDRPDWQDRQDLLQDGISTFKSAADNTVSIERIVTSYLVDANGLADATYQDEETSRTINYLGYSMRVRIAQTFPRFKLADDGTRIAAGQPIVTPSMIRNELIALANDWEDAGLVENIAAFKAGLVVLRSTTDRNRVDALVPPEIIKQFRVLAAQIQFSQ